ncbi:NAD(P)-binding protein [Trichoderma sp. SZMC 28014]
MASIAKTIIATGASSGLGFEAIKQLLSQKAQPYKVFLGARNTQSTIAAYDSLAYDRSGHAVTVLPLELSDLKTVKTFSQQVLDKIGGEKIDYLLLNAAISGSAEKSGPKGWRWCEPLVVNHFSQHYLTHLLKGKLIESKSRIVVVSSGAIRRITDPSILDDVLKAGAGAGSVDLYSGSKFIQLLSAHWWRRELAGQCDVVACSPGLIPGTGIGRGSGMQLTMDMPDAKPVATGAQSILAAFTRSDFPSDPDQIFLTSWGEWWSKETIGTTLDKNLQDKWSWSKEEIEKEAGITE